MDKFYKRACVRHNFYLWVLSRGWIPNKRDTTFLSNTHIY